MKLNIKDYITLPAVNETLESGKMTKDEALNYVTDVAAHVALADDSSDDGEVIESEPVDNGISTGDSDDE